MSPGTSLVSPFATLALFLVLLIAAGLVAVWLRRGLPALGLGRGRRLVLLERLELGDRRFVALVRLDRTELLLGGAVQGVTLLRAQEAAAEPELPVAAPRHPFAEVLARLSLGRGGTGAGADRS